MIPYNTLILSELSYLLIDKFQLIFNSRGEHHLLVNFRKFKQLSKNMNKYRSVIQNDVTFQKETFLNDFPCFYIICNTEESRLVMNFRKLKKWKNKNNNISIIIIIKIKEKITDIYYTHRSVPFKIVLNIFTTQFYSTQLLSWNFEIELVVYFFRYFRVLKFCMLVCSLWQYNISIFLELNCSINFNQNFDSIQDDALL